MGNCQSTNPQTPPTSSATQLIRKPRILCLHGMRTSGEILFKQTMALRNNTAIQCDFIDAPYEAEGPPDEGVQTFYPDMDYFEWIKHSSGQAEGIDEGIELIIKHLTTKGPYDGVLGFSQGAAMTTRLAYLQHTNDPKLQTSDGRKLFNFVILIGGVTPLELYDPQSNPIRIGDSLPSMHIAGTADPFHSRSIELYTHFYSTSSTSDDTSTPSNSAVLLEHPEAHNIPSIRTGLYPAIKEWIYKNYQNLIAAETTRATEPTDGTSGTT